jgi:glyoxylase-like metal-dependent hydrolase (beta-lactamase superfamily II)
MIRVGEYDLISVQTGSVRLDGGAMFGVVPWVLWAPHEDVDEQNRILLATRTLIAVSGDRRHVVLTDMGAGTKWSTKEAARFDVRYDSEAIRRSLEEHFGLTPGDVTDIIVTHLHFDHSGGLTRWADEPGGDTRLCYPNARHWIHRRHWDHAREPNDKDRASFMNRDFEALESASILSVVDGDEPSAPWPGVRFMVSDGHTPGQLLPVFAGGGPDLIFTGDMFPTSSHLRVPWVMAYDVEPLKTIEEKKRVLCECRKLGVWLAFPHDHRLGGGEIGFAAGRPFIARPLDL